MEKIVLQRKCDFWTVPIKLGFATLRHVFLKMQLIYVYVKKLNFKHRNV